MTIRSAALSVSLAFFGWLAVLTGVTALSDSAPAALVLFPSETFMARLPEGTGIVEATAFSVTLAADAPDLAKALYRSGAWIVLPAGLSGCSA